MQQEYYQEYRDFDMRGWNALKRWYRCGEGQQCASVETRTLAGVLSSLFGAYIVALGMPMQNCVLDESPISRHYQLELPYSELSSGIDWVSDPEQLPISNNIIDVIVLPHVLEFGPRPRAILNEAKRVLTPDGYMAILGFNPLSIVHLWRHLVERFGNPSPKYMPFGAHLLSAFTVRGWLSEIGFELVSLRYFQGFPGTRLWSGKSGYLIVVKKRTHTLTMIRPRWRSRRLPAAGIPYRT